MEHADPFESLPYAAFVAVFDDAGRILLVAEEYDRKRYGLPGGGIEPGESPADAAIRELREEAGVGIRLDYLIGMFRFRGRLNFFAFVFRGTIVDGVPQVPADDDVIDLTWSDPANLPSALTFTAPYTIRAAVEGERGIVEVIEISG